MTHFSFLIFLTLFNFQPPISDLHSNDVTLCLKCHEGIEMLDEKHDFPCERCHLLPEHRRGTLKSHEMIIRYPASSSHAEIFCKSCHRKELSDLRNSLHCTLAGMVNQTRYLWGAQPDPTTRYGAGNHESLKALPPTPAVIQTPADLADDFLRRRCLYCHLDTVPPQERGFYRGLGCAACHILYENDGVCRGNDPAIKGKKGYPKEHRFCKPIPVRQCLHCHNGPRIGADYEGRFEHDYHQSYRAPVQNGLLPEQIYLADHHRLIPDIHCERGLTCTDCHSKGDVMGRGKLAGRSAEAVAVRCRDCHTPETSVTAHSIPQMKRVGCVSCHSAWGFTDYGFSVLRDDRSDLSQWAAWRLQGDNAVARCFDEQGRFTGNDSGSGVWFAGWRFRRWEFLTLGVDSQDRIVPFRPRYQYLVSFVDKAGRVISDSVVPQRGDNSGAGWAFMPFYPHTVRKHGRSCEACHGQPLAAGKGLWEGEGADLVLTKPSPPVYPEMRLLSESEKERLLNKTKAYRQWRFRSMLPFPQ